MVNKRFADANPVVADVFRKLSVPLEGVDGAIAAAIPPTRTPPRKIAEDYLRAHPGVVAQWVPPDVAQRINIALK